MENYMMIDGVKIPLTDDQVKMMRSGPCEQNPFARTERTDKKYFWMDSTSKVVGSTDWDYNCDVDRYNCANYCTDKKLLTQRAFHETLNRLLWRFSMENGEGERLWSRENCHWHISMDMRWNEIVSIPTMEKKISGTIYFPSEKIANRAIEEIVKPFMASHPDFIW